MTSGFMPIRGKEFLNASWWYFVGPPPAEGGRRPHAGAAASPAGWPPPKTSLFIQKVFDCKWYYIPPLATPSPPFSRGERIGVRGGSYTHVPCPFGALLVTLYQIFSKGFLNGKRDIGSGASPQRGLAPPKKKVYPGKASGGVIGERKSTPSG
jgi:hypothetical protein